MADDWFKQEMDRAERIRARERGERHACQDTMNPHLKAYLDERDQAAAVGEDVVVSAPKLPHKLPEPFQYEGKDGRMYYVEYGTNGNVVVEAVAARTTVLVGVYTMDEDRVVGSIERGHLPDALADMIEARYVASV